jgi:hypothetical protein
MHEPLKSLHGYLLLCCGTGVVDGRRIAEEEEPYQLFIVPVVTDHGYRYFVFVPVVRNRGEHCIEIMVYAPTGVDYAPLCNTDSIAGGHFLAKVPNSSFKPPALTDEHQLIERLYPDTIRMASCVARRRYRGLV